MIKNTEGAKKSKWVFKRVIKVTSVESYVKISATNGMKNYNYTL